MAFVFNGVTIPESVGALKFNGIDITSVITNGILMWTTQPRSTVFTASGTFTVPVGVTSVNICMVGGGAGGNSSQWANNYGGQAGAVVGQAVAVTEGQAIGVTIGAGGAGGPQNTYGGVGGASAFGGIVAGGGSNSYGGQGGMRTTCAGNAWDGGKSTYSFGGQAGFGNGGYGADYTVQGSGGNGGVGAGGGGQWGYGNGGYGGRGEVRISW